ncbi:anthrone oxygenase family protein [Flindersiella endophytica]
MFTDLVLIVATVLTGLAAGVITLFSHTIMAVVVITMTVNVPLNDALKAAGDPDRINLAQARTAFKEPTWTTWNHVRVVASIGAFVILVTFLAAT